MTNVKTSTSENRYSVPFEFGTSARDKPNVRYRSITVDIVRRGRARTVKREMTRFVRYAHLSLTSRDESVSRRVIVNSREEGILYEKHQAHNLIEHKNGFPGCSARRLPEIEIPENVASFRERERAVQNTTRPIWRDEQKKNRRVPSSTLLVDFFRSKMR